MRASDYSWCWPTPSAHQQYWDRHNNPYIYEYDPTDDGPEAMPIRLIRASHTQFELDIENV